MRVKADCAAAFANDLWRVEHDAKGTHLRLRVFEALKILSDAWRTPQKHYERNDRQEFYHEPNVTKREPQPQMDFPFTLHACVVSVRARDRRTFQFIDARRGGRLDHEHLIWRPLAAPNRDEIIYLATTYGYQGRGGDCHSVIGLIIARWVGA